MPAFSEEQVIGLAPDEGSVKSGRELANQRKWVSFGANESAVWGECQGSGSKPYQACVDVSEPAFKCSCPSRKFPCKHGLGLLLLNCRENKAFEGKESPPDWVTQWLENRGEKAQKKAKKKEDASTAEPDPIAKAKRQADRQSKVESGLNDFSLWLQDRIRQGLAGLETQSYQFWEGQAARLTDAQAPGLARLLRSCAGIPNSGEGWQSQLLGRLSLMHSIVEGYQRINDLPEGVQQDLRNAIGFTVNQDEVLKKDGLKDRWQVLGQRVEIDEKLKTQRTWLRGERTGRWALILSFAHGPMPLDVSFSAGMIYDAELCFFPGGFPLRALLKEKTDTVGSIKSIQAYAHAEAFLDDYSLALAANPFLDNFPLAMENVTAVPSAKGMLLVDVESMVIPLVAIPDALKWQMLALSGGHPFSIFGEWQGERMLPMAMLSDGVFHRLDQKVLANVT